MGREEEDKEGKIAAGKFVPAAEVLLPGTRKYRLEGAAIADIDYEHAYHFGSIARSGRGWRQIGVQIGTPIPGSGSVISDAWVQIGNNRVTSVPAGSQFDIYCTYVGVNNGGGHWALCITVVGIGTGIANFDINSTDPGTSTQITGTGKLLASLNATNVMPAGTTLQLRFKMWMTDNSHEIYPPSPQSLW